MLYTDTFEKEQTATEEEMLMELDKGIDDMETGRTVTHEEAMKRIRESVGTYAI